MSQQAPQGSTGRSMNTAAALGAVAIVIVAAIVLFAVTRTGDQNTAARPSGSPASTASASGAPAGTPSSSATVTPSPASTSAAPAAGVKPDAAHGLITFENIRSEVDPTGLQQPPEFSRSGTASFSVAVSPDGKRVAMIRGGSTGQQLITFTTAKPKDITFVLDFSGSGEVAGEIVWAGDGTDFVVFSADRRSATTITYSAIRSVDLSAKKQSEIARVTTGLHLMPLAWSFNSHVGGAVDVDSSSGGRVSSYYVIRDNALTDRTALSGSFNTQISASRDGKRIVAVTAPSLRWWPVDQPAAVKEMSALNNSRVEYAAFRPGADELGVRAGAPSASAGVPPPGHFEIWTLSGQQRVVSPTIGFSFWRVDGTAAIDGSLLVDPATGATTQLPGGAFKIADVVLF
jgi:hypothetical protein